MCIRDSRGRDHRRHAVCVPLCQGLPRERPERLHLQQGDGGHLPVSYTHLDVYKRQEVTFSEKAQQELKLLDNALEKILTLTTDAFEFDDARTASQVEPLEQVIDILVERLRAQHIKRLKDGVCSIDTGVVYLDVLNNVERISDHCSNIAARLVGMEAGEDYDSHTLKNMMHHNPTKEYMLNYEQCRKDYLVPLEQLEA